MRSRHIGELYGILTEAVSQRTTAEWVDLLKDADIPMTPISTPEDLLHDPHLEKLEFFRREAYPSEGDIRTIGIPVRFSRTPGAVRRLAPRLGEHRAEILEEIGQSERRS